MAEETKISWAHATWNPWIGCAKVAPECANCYAERDWDKRRHHANWGPAGTRVLTSESYWRKPYAWNRKAVEAQTRLRVFPSLCDPFEDFQGTISIPGAEGSQPTVTTMSQVRDLLFKLIDETPQLDWLLLTKRPENIAKFWHGGYRFNVWLGTSAGCQESADKMIPHLLDASSVCRFRFLSAEPLIGPLDLRSYLRRLDWVIAGGESGPVRRPMEADWVRTIRDQCFAYSVPFHFKQWGGPNAGGEALLDGKEHREIPGAFVVDDDAPGLVGLVD